MTSNPFFSIIMATYNREHIIERAIKSVFKQEFQNWELIIIDDGSTDNTVKLLKNIVDNELRVKIIRKAHEGHVKARNTGIKLARGKYITFLDSDDEYKPEHLLTRAEYLKDNPEVDGVVGGVEAVGNPYVFDVTNPSKLIHIDKCGLCGSIFARKSLFIKVGGFSEDKIYGGEYTLIEKFKEHRAKIKRIKIKTYRYHRTEQDSITNLFKKGGLKAVKIFLYKKAD